MSASAREGSDGKPVACPVCGAGETQAEIVRVDDHITGDPFSIRNCPACTVRFTWPMPQDLEPYYPSRYRGYGPVARTVLQALYRLRVAGWVRRAGRPGKVLEIGCGPGLMLDALRRHGWDVTGVERTEAMADYARRTLGLNVLSGGTERLPDGVRYDLVILFQVLEHMRDPLGVLRDCAARLKPGGLLLVNVPNLDSWQARFGGGVWLHLDPPRHLFHFTPGSLAGILDKAGLEVVGTGFSSFEHDPFGWIQTAVNRVVGRPQLLTRYLMGLDRFSLRVFLSAVLGAFLAIPAVLLAAASWRMRKGALMQMMATLRVRPGA